MVNLVYGALLLHSAGKPITEENVKKVIEAAGEKVGDAQIKALVAALEGVDIKSAIEKAAIAPVAAPVEKKEEKIEEEKEEDREKKATEAAAGLAGLFA